MSKYLIKMSLAWLNHDVLSIPVVSMKNPQSYTEKITKHKSTKYTNNYILC